MRRPGQWSHCFSPAEPRCIQTLPCPQELKTMSSWAGPALIPPTFGLCCSLDECTWTDAQLSGQQLHDLVSATHQPKPWSCRGRSQHVGKTPAQQGRERQGDRRGEAARKEQLVKSALKGRSKPITNSQAQAPDERVLWGMNVSP